MSRLFRARTARTSISWMECIPGGAPVLPVNLNKHRRAVTKRLTTAALALVTATGTAMAEQHMNEVKTATTIEHIQLTSSVDLANQQGELIRMSDITDGTIYSTDPEEVEGWEVGTTYDAVGENWNDIGEIEDLVLDQNGSLTGIVAEVGGFLDIGDKDVLLSVSDVNLVAAEEYAYVTRLTEEELESLPDVDDDAWWQ